MRKPSRIKPEFLTTQKTKRTTLQSEPGQAGGLPEVNDRIQIIEEILAIHSYSVTP